MSPTRSRFLQRSLAIFIALLVATPDAVLAAEGIATSKSMELMSQQELDRFVQQLNETANWRKYRRPNDPPDFVPGKPVKVMNGAGSFGRGGGGGGGGFRKSGLANRRSSRSGRGKNRDSALAQDRGNSRSNRNGSSASSGSNSRSRSSSSSSSRSSGSNFGNSNGSSGSAFDQ